MLFAFFCEQIPMQVRTVRKPGEPGTQSLVAKYGDRLVCVRYRYDPLKHRRYKTVELIIAEEDWHPQETNITESAPKPQRLSTTIVPLRIHYTERDLQRQVKAIGGTWDPSKKLWYAPEEYIRRIGLTKRIVR
jgi:hypothetical protein